MDLEDLPEEIVPHVNLLIETAREQGSAQALGKLTSEISRFYRALGICCLLVEADVDGFFHWLIQSAITRRYFLDRCRREGLLDHAYRKASLVGPFLDAVAASQRQLATEIAALSPDAWMKGEEYEDDFAYAHFLHTLCAGGPESGLDGALAQFEQALEGGEAVRLDVCKALRAKDQKAFDDAFEALLQEHQEKTDELADPKRDSILAQDYAFEPDRQVNVEALALLRLAEWQGLKTPTETRYCPAPARRKVYGAFKSMGYPGLALDGPAS